MSTAVRVFIPRETTALSLGADEVAGAIMREAEARGSAVDIVRNGSRGAAWLEPLVEVETPDGRIAYGPVTTGEVPALFDAGFLAGGAHALRQGAADAIPWLAGQTRLTFARAGVTDPLSLADYEAHGGLAGLRTALEMAPAAIVAAVTESGLRGRGGAAFPTGIKWKTVLETEAARKYVVCNADEGDSGTFADRMLIECDPWLLIEGMVIAGLAVGAEEGVVFLRSEYPLARMIFTEALGRAREAGLLGADVLGSGRAFDIRLCLGAGAYICGEETSMLESLEGKRGEVRAKPPLPAVSGLFGCPSVINNVLTLAAVPFILAEGAEAYRDHGSGRSRGTTAFQLAGNIRRGGLYEAPFGLSLRTLVEEIGGGTASGRPLKAVQVGGPLGAYIPAAKLDIPLDYEAFAEAGAMLGHGGIVVFDDSADMGAQARYAMEFCAHESCGKCTPCRIGAVRGMEVLDRLRAGAEPEKNWRLLEDLLEVMEEGSLCAMGGLTPQPVKSVMTHFAGELRAK
ncbi:MAG: formate dehydrogenase beta subunit [Alphaproteobacteria bacterium]|nr:MAG: formate dehydrogenase beta subunit [Alphaproteobacteria bacterium]